MRTLEELKGDHQRVDLCDMKAFFSSKEDIYKYLSEQQQYCLPPLKYTPTGIDLSQLTHIFSLSKKNSLRRKESFQVDRNKDFQGPLLYRGNKH